MDRETAFRDHLQRAHEWVRDATRQEQVLEHIDFLTHSFGKVEFKSAKKMARHDRGPHKTFTAVEVMSVQDKHGSNHPGWVFGGADTIVFETPTYSNRGRSFRDCLFVERARLAACVQQWADFVPVFRPQHATTPFSVYYRENGARGAIVHMPYAALQRMAHTQWTGIAVAAVPPLRGIKRRRGKGGGRAPQHQHHCGGEGRNKPPSRTRGSAGSRASRASRESRESRESHKSAFSGSAAPSPRATKEEDTLSWTDSPKLVPTTSPFAQHDGGGDDVTAML